MKARALKLLRYAVDRAKEPSSWAGVGAIAAMLGHSLSDTAVAGIVVIGSGVAGAIAILLPEGSTT